MASDLWIIAVMLMAALLGAGISYALLRHWQISSREQNMRAVAELYHERK
ncbi:hypothetical protein [Rhizobium sp. RU36D]|nr:hypothetical protein [Rhizobium sp. RU36D]SMC99626.1 hypothetical protein SAMN05880593_11424 [Rhizobium sp. RU36D]